MVLCMILIRQQKPICSGFKLQTHETTGFGRFDQLPDGPSLDRAALACSFHR
jgi:hypothetical protein